MKSKKNFLISFLIIFSSIGVSLPVISNTNSNETILKLNNQKNILSTKKNINSLDINSDDANTLIEQDGRLDGAINSVLQKTLSSNINKLYDNLNLELNPPLDSAFEYRNLKIIYQNNVVGIQCSIVPIDKTIFYLPDQNQDEYISSKLTFDEFVFSGFNIPLETKLLSTSINEGKGDIFPFEVNQANFKNIINFKFQHEPRNLIYKNAIMSYDNANGRLIFNQITIDRFYPNDSYSIVNQDKTFKNIETIGFKKAVITDINGVVFYGTDINGLKNQILQYLVNNNMAPKTNFNQSNINVTINSQNSATVIINGYFDVDGRWQNKQSSPQNIVLNTNNTTINNTIQNNGTLSYYMPYLIQTLVEQNDQKAINGIKEILIRNIITTTRPIVPNDIENIVITKSNNIENNAYIDVEFDLINVGLSNGNNVPKLHLTTRIVGLSYIKTTFSLKKNQDLSNKAADWISQSNFNNVIEINNKIPGAEYTLNDVGAEYYDGYANLFINVTKSINNNGDVVNEPTSIKIRIDGFKKLQSTKIEWNVIPYSIAVDNEFLKKNFIIKNLNDYQNVYFANDVIKVPAIESISLLNKNHNGEIHVRIVINNYFDPNKKIIDKYVNEDMKISCLKTIEGITLKENHPNLTDNNVYDYINIVPALWEYFGLESASWTSEKLKEAFKNNGLEIVIKNNVPFLYYNNESLGQIKISQKIPQTSDNTLNILMIVLIVVGVLGVILLVIFFVIYNLLNKKEKKIKEEKENSSELNQ